jgi:hypothetical protein
MSPASSGEVGGARALVIGFADPARGLELALDGLRVTAVVRRADGARRWQAAARAALPASGLERFRVIAAGLNTLETKPGAYARILIGPRMDWAELADRGAWLARLLIPAGELVMRALPGQDPIWTLRELVEPIAAQFSLLAVDRDDRELIVRARRCDTHAGNPEHAFAELALASATRSSQQEELIFGLRQALSVRDRLVLAQRERLRAQDADVPSTPAELGRRAAELARRIATARRAVRAESEQLAAMLASADKLLAQRSRTTPLR